MNALKTKWIDFLKAVYSRWQRLKNKNHSPTIISNDCVGGIMYNTLGLRFCSPTIDLFFRPLSDYIHFCQDIKYYANCPLEDVTDNEQYRKGYPVGLLIGDSKHPPVPLHFLHYDSFESAKRKWIERSQRIDYDNIYYVLHFNNAIENVNDLFAFDSLPVNKLCILHEDVLPIGNKAIVSIEDDQPAKILEYRKDKPWKRYLEDVDYISFLNNRPLRR